MNILLLLCESDYKFEVNIKSQNFLFLMFISKALFIACQERRTSLLLLLLKCCRCYIKNEMIDYKRYMIFLH